MKYFIGSSEEENAAKAILQATAQIGKECPKLIVYFGDKRGFWEYSKELKIMYPNAVLIGTTACRGVAYQNSYQKSFITLVAWMDMLECYGGVLREAKRFPMKYIGEIENSLSKMEDTKNTICLEFTTAFGFCEELVLAAFNKALHGTDIPVVGGSSGNSDTTEKTYVAFDGCVYEDACAFVLLRNLGGKIGIYKENIYKPTKHSFIATKVDVERRIIYELNHEPAVKVLSSALHVSAEELPKLLPTHPLGRIVSGDIYITENSGIYENGALSYYARAYNNTKMVLLEEDDYRYVLQATMTQVKKDILNPSFSLMIQCVARAKTFEKDHYAQEFLKSLYDGIGAVVGYSGYGEQLGNHHLNQTMILIAFE